MNQYDFQKTLKKYLAGQHTQEEEDFILDHFKNNPMQEMPVFEDEKAVIGKRIKKKLVANTIGEPLLIRLRPYLAAAASILVVLGFWYFLVKKNAPETIAEMDFSPNDSVIEIKNTSGKSQNIPMEDGSIVILQKNSSISYPEHFGKKNRLVYLHGEAFFQIKRNPAKPFIVSTGTLVTKVLGTSFTIKSYDESASVEVQVKTGRVSVYEGAANNVVNRNGVILTPNQKIVFDKKSKKIELSIIENPMLVIPVSETEHGFTFSEVPVKHVFSALEKSYGIDIVLENDSTDSCLFTGDLNGLSLFQQLDLICQSANITYERRGTALFVQGAGCGD
ncbi:FecR family protein [Dyadobacter fanqingshengii]|uniref:FecR family protein n=1 Tax=Dyadobacter fanqingshengii TaxID=2906443 RepID=A0A9X1P866_9BACT|nr:FecR family protein [Dyadobacter fanqingshengii]MCF0038948.1 FecR family protein [Dyadobacter fanqingshengii]USJ34229.1 FecR family protein [Dyadobacter fanqingshengii]